MVGIGAGTSATTITNQGVITISSGDKTFGMYADGSNGPVVATNEKEGTITISSGVTNSYGMYATGKDASIINNGAITINATSG